MIEKQQAAKYINSLKYSIQECVILHDVFSVDEAHNKALKIERLQSRTINFKRQMTFEKSSSGAGTHSNSPSVNPLQSTDTTTSAPVVAPAAAVKNKENP